MIETVLLEDIGNLVPNFWLNQTLILFPNLFSCYLHFLIMDVLMLYAGGPQFKTTVWTGTYIAKQGGH